MKPLLSVLLAITPPAVFLSLVVTGAVADQVTLPGGGVVTIIGSGPRGSSVAHGCVVEGQLLTAAHVVHGHERVRWSDLAGREGEAWVAWVSPNSDLVLLGTDVPVGRGFERALTPPSPGQKALVVHFDAGRPRPFAHKTMLEVEVTGEAAGHVAFTTPDPVYMRGSSGGCLVVGGHVVGVVSFGWLHGAKIGAMGAPVGGLWTSEAVAIYGRWKESRP